MGALPELSEADDAALIARVAAESDNETVRTALDHLMVVTRMAHAEEIVAARKAEAFNNRLVSRAMAAQRSATLQKMSSGMAHREIIQRVLARIERPHTREEVERRRKAIEARGLKAVWQRMRDRLRGR